MKGIIKFLSVIAMSFIFGIGISTATEIEVLYTSSGVFALSNIVGFAMPDNVLASAVVFKTAYQDELLKQLKEVKGNFLKRIPNVSHLLRANTINYTKIGAKPDVLIDNTVYPIPGAQRTDDGRIVSLKKLTTTGTIITRDEIHNLPYDKTNSVISQHKESLLEQFYKLALYSFAAEANTATTPVLQTTGTATTGGRKRLTKEDLIRFRTALTKTGVGQCDLVLCADHVEDMLLWSQVFENQYHNIVKGQVLPLYGFSIVQGEGHAPVYKGTAKQGLKAQQGTDKFQASVAYLPKRMFRAYGDVEMFYTPANAKYHQDEVNFDAYVIAAPKDNEGRGAIVSGK